MPEATTVANVPIIKFRVTELDSLKDNEVRWKSEIIFGITSKGMQAFCNVKMEMLFIDG